MSSVNKNGEAGMFSRKTARWSRLPSAADLHAFNGLHCGSIWREVLRTNWHCPCCDRTPYELVRWSEIRGPTWRERYADQYGMGWTVSFARHHCHGSGRFQVTLICGDCNTADGAAKRKLNLPKDWSFSPKEIAQFVRTQPHSGRTEVDYQMAREIYDDQRKAA